MINFEALFKISYGLYIVCSGDKNKGNGFISNTVFQVTAEPAKFAACCHKNNLTAEFIKKYQAFSVSILEQNATSEIISKFGYKSGNDVDKMSGAIVKYGDTGVPVVLNDSLAFFECKVVETIDVGTHLMFIGELISAEIIDDTKEPLTYSYYRQAKKGVAPKNAPTYIDKSKLETKAKSTSSKKYKCATCGYIYDEATENVKFEDLPSNWVCPLCGTEKSDFFEI
ncbi:MAG: High molecular weight rubredoxin [Bacteroidetes bacterium]|nr:High molecular weight rubredoxin [Bacteroidota bacterium]